VPVKVSKPCLRCFQSFWIVPHCLTLRLL
jgi:hypothetical protein